jgi:hypothetical protein
MRSVAVKPITVYLTLSSYGIPVKPLMIPRQGEADLMMKMATVEGEEPGAVAAAAQEEGPYKSHARRSHPS